MCRAGTELHDIVLIIEISSVEEGRETSDTHQHSLLHHPQGQQSHPEDTQQPQSSQCSIQRLQAEHSAICRPGRGGVLSDLYTQHTGPSSAPYPLRRPPHTVRSMLYTLPGSPRAPYTGMAVDFPLYHYRRRHLLTSLLTGKREGACRHHVFI